MKRSKANFASTGVLAAILLVLTTINQGCKAKDLQEQILGMSEIQRVLEIEKDSLMKVLAIKGSTVEALQSDTLLLASEINELAVRNRQLASANAARTSQLKSTEAKVGELEAQAAVEAAKNDALQNELNTLHSRLAAIDSELAATQKEKELLAANILAEDEKRIADSIAEANKPVPVATKTSGWYMNVTELSAGFGLGETNVDYSRSFFGVTNVFGYSFSNNLMGGIGTGIHAYNGGLMIPLYLDFRYSFRGERFNPFIVADGGYMISLESFNTSGLFIHPGVGISRKLGNKSAMHLTIGPLIQNAPSGFRSTFIQVKGGVTLRGK